MPNVFKDITKFAPTFLYIVDKDQNKVKLRFNPTQLAFHQNRSKRDIVLKPRQKGISTYVLADYFRMAITQTVNTATLLQDDDATQLFRFRNQIFYDGIKELICKQYGVNPYEATSQELARLPIPKREYSNATITTYPEYNSRCYIATVGSAQTGKRGKGRGGTYSHVHACLSPDTPVVDPITGKLVRMGDLSIGDLVLTHTGKIATISHISKQIKLTKKISIRGLQKTPLVASNEHRFWTKGGWKTVDELTTKDYIGYPIKQIDNSFDKWQFKLPDVLRKQGGGSVERVPDEIKPSYELGRILGLYLAEGCIKKQHDKTTTSSVTFSVHENEVNRTCEWLDSLSGLYKSYKVNPKKNSRCVNVNVYGKSFSQFVLDRCGEVDSKHLPVNWFNCGAEFVRGLVHGYLSGDGHFSKTRDRKISATSIRSAISIGMRDAIAALGYGWANISYRKSGRFYGRNCQECWTLVLCGKGVIQLSKELNKPYVEYVHPNKANGNNSVFIENGYAWMAVVSIENNGEIETLDFEIDHEDHSFCLLHGASHNSEVAFWQDAQRIVSGLMQGGNPEIIIESTPNGAQGYYYDICMEVIDQIPDWQDKLKLNKTWLQGLDWRLHFFSWFHDDEYQLALEPDETIEFTTDTKHGFMSELELQEYCNKMGYVLTPEQVKWRRAKIRELKHEFIQEYPEDLLSCFILSGIGYFGDIRHAIMPDGYLPIFDSEHKYYGGLDFGQSNDFTVLSIIDKDTKQQVDMLRINRMSWGEMRKQIKMMCGKWGVKLLLAEKNSIGSVNIEELKKEFAQTNQAFKQELLDKYPETSPEFIKLYKDGKIPTRIMEFTTTNLSKAEIMSDLHEGIHEYGLKLLPDPNQKRELQAFTRKYTSAGTPILEAPESEHDDTVIALALAWHCAMKMGRTLIH